MSQARKKKLAHQPSASTATKGAPAGKKKPASPGRPPPVVSSAVDSLTISTTAPAEGSASLLLDVTGGPGQLHFRCAPGFWVAEPRGGVTVKPGDQVQIEVRYRPNHAGVRNSQLVIVPTFGPSLFVPLVGKASKMAAPKQPDPRVPIAGSADDGIESAQKRVNDETRGDFERVEDGDRRQVRVDEIAGPVDLAAELSNVQVNAEAMVEEQARALDDMAKMLKAPVQSPPGSLIDSVADAAVVFAAGAIGHMASDTFKGHITRLAGASQPALAIGLVVVAGIKDVIKREVKKAGAERAATHKAVDRFISRMKRSLNVDTSVGVKEYIINKRRTIAEHPEGPAIARALYLTFSQLRLTAHGVQCAEVFRQWARLLSAGGREPGGAIAGRQPEGTIEIRLSDSLVGHEPLVESAAWRGLPEEAAAYVASSNQEPITLLELGIPYRLIINDGEAVIERWPDETRPRFSPSTAEYWLADYWGWKVKKPGRSPNGNVPNPQFVARGLESLVGYIDSQTMNDLGLVPSIAPAEKESPK